MATRTKVEGTGKAGEVVSRRRFTVEEYYRMAEAGILHEDDRVELIGGEILEMSPIGGQHARCVTELARILTRQAGEDVRISPQNPVRLGGQEEPQPDIAVILASQRYLAGELPTPEDVLFLIEVSDSSLRYDREVKLPLYASFGIREVWIVDLEANVVERHTDPRDDSYRLVRRAGRGETLASEVLAGVEVPVDSVTA